MNKVLPLFWTFFVLFSLTAQTSEFQKETSPPSSKAVILEEHFDNVTTLEGKGWNMQNLSSPIGAYGWFQGNPNVFPSYDGDEDSYIAVNYSSGSGAATISNWLFTPVVSLSNSSTLKFWTKSAGAGYADRLQVRMSTNGNSVDVGTSHTSIGDFSILLLDINPNYDADGYPEEWTEYILDITEVAEATDGRIAFRYYIEDGGHDGTNGNYIGIDNLIYATENSGTNVSTLPIIQNIQAYPNPTANIINLTIDSQYNAKVIDVVGRVVIETVLDSSDSSIDLTGHSSGVYLIQLSDKNNGTIHNLKIVKE